MPVDGGLPNVNYGALGIYWTRYRFSGPGSHTNTSAGRPHPARALADAIRGIYEIEIPDSRAIASGSTDANAGVVRGIPSISIGRSIGGDQHTLSEWSEVDSALTATKIALLIAIAMAGLGTVP